MSKQFSVRAYRASQALRQRGQSSVEYIVVASLSILVLIAGGNSAPVQMLIKAIKDVYLGFIYAMSLATTGTFF